MFGGLDDPDEGHAAGGHGAIGVTLDEVADEGNVVGDADAAGEEKNGAVGVEGVDAAVGAFGEGLEGDAGVHAVLGAGEEFIGEAGAAADEEGEGGFLVGAEGVLVGHGNALFVSDDFGGFTPGDGEWMGGPPAYGGDVEVNVLTGFEGPWTGEVEGDAQGVTREGLDDCGGEFTAAVAVDDVGKTCSSLRQQLAFYCSIDIIRGDAYLQSPENDCNQKIVLRRHALQVNPQETKGNGGHGNVQMKECLIKGMTDRRRRVYHESGKGTSRDQATQHKVTHPKHHPHHIPARLVRLRDGPSEGVRNGFKHNNASQPPMQQVPGIKRHPKQGDQRVVATSHQHQRHEIDSGHSTSAIPHHAGDGMLIAPVRHGNHTNRDIHHHNSNNQEHMEPRRQCAKVDSGGKLEFAVMTPPE